MGRIVHVVVSGEFDEGYTIVKVFGTHKKALDFINQQYPKFLPYVRFDAKNNPVTEWVNGCDYVTIEEWMIQ